MTVVWVLATAGLLAAGLLLWAGLRKLPAPPARAVGASEGPPGPAYERSHPVWTLDLQRSLVTIPRRR
jgi:hypothetical protein